MAGAYSILPLSFKPTEAMTKYRAVTISGPSTIDLADAQGERCVGIVQDAVSASDVTNGRYVNVLVLGVSRAYANGTVAVGAVVTASADGSVETAASGDFPIGIALMAAADNDQFDILLTPSGVPLA